MDTAFNSRNPAPAASGGASRQPSESSRYLLRFDSLFSEGRGLAFPCDADGHVDIDRLSERARNNYFYARTVVGREFATPAVRADWVH